MTTDLEYAVPHDRLRIAEEHRSRVGDDERAHMSIFEDDHIDGGMDVYWGPPHPKDVERLVRAGEHCRVIVVPNPFVPEGHASPEIGDFPMYFAVNPLEIAVASEIDWRPTVSVPEDWSAA